MFERYTEDAKRAVFFARHEASRAGCSEINPWHIVLGLMHDNGTQVERLFALRRLESDIRKTLQISQKAVIPTYKDVPLSKESKMVLAYALEESQTLGEEWIGSEHLFAGIFRLENLDATKYLQNVGMSIDSVRESIRSNPASRPFFSPSAMQRSQGITWVWCLAVLISFIAGYEICLIFHAL